jgi:hypothetical protein
MIKKFESWKSTNPVKYLEVDDILDILTEITDQFGYRYKIFNSKIYVPSFGGLEKRTVLSEFYLRVPKNQLENFNQMFKQSKRRFLDFIGQTFDSDISNGSTTNDYDVIFMKFEFHDSRIDKDEQVITFSKMPGKTNE